MRTAINHLQSVGIEQVVVAGFSLGARLTTAHVARGQIDELPIIGLIGIGMYATSIDPLNISETLDEVNIPVLDIYGSTDTNAVNTALSRLNAYNSASGLSYTQTPLTCINGLNCHQLEGLKGDDSKMFEVEINAWMQTFAPATVHSGCTVETTSSSSSQNASGGGSLSLLFIGLLFLALAFYAHYRKK